MNIKIAKHINLLLVKPTQKHLVITKKLTLKHSLNSDSGYFWSYGCSFSQALAAAPCMAQISHTLKTTPLTTSGRLCYLNRQEFETGMNLWAISGVSLLKGHSERKLIWFTLMWPRQSHDALTMVHYQLLNENSDSRGARCG